jgi:hypothetical protein
MIFFSRKMKIFVFSSEGNPSNTSSRPPRLPFSLLRKMSDENIQLEIEQALANITTHSGLENLEEDPQTILYYEVRDDKLRFFLLFSVSHFPFIFPSLRFALSVHQISICHPKFDKSVIW